MSERTSPVPPVPVRVMRRYRVYGPQRGSRYYVLDTVSDEFVSGPMNKRGAEMLVKKLEAALAAAPDQEGE